MKEARREIKKLEKLMGQLTNLQSGLATTDAGVMQYEGAKLKLQKRYHNLTGRYYHFKKEVKE